MINWLVQSMADTPTLPAEAWLSPPERERLAQLRVEKKRREWLLGRWTAKALVRSTLERAGHDLALLDITILPAADGAPELFVGGGAGAPASPTLSISHSAGRAFCALSRGPVGADIELIAPRAPGFVADYFTPAEQAHIASSPPEQRDTLVTAVWSAKEAVLKALRRGLTVDTRLVECLPPLHAAAAGLPHGQIERDPLPGGQPLPRLLPTATSAPEAWAPFTATVDPSLGDLPAGISCWWRAEAGYVLTLAAAGPPETRV